jgi:hypothetical protein
MGVRELPNDEKKEIWEGTYRTHYEASYGAELADMLLGRWQAIFYVVTVATAITASGSLVAGLALWTEPGWKIIWSTFAGGAALIVIIHNAL